MFSRIEKCYNRPRHFKTVSYDIILKLIFQNPIKIILCHYCKNKRFIYLSCPFHSDRYSEYVRNNQSYYDVRNLSILQFRKIVVQHSKAKSELVRAEKE